MEKDFYEDSYEEYYDGNEEDYFESDDYVFGSYGWAEEDIWIALTDGMYGDMPSDPMVYDAIIEALGF